MSTNAPLPRRESKGKFPSVYKMMYIVINPLWRLRSTTGKLLYRGDITQDDWQYVDVNGEQIEDPRGTFATTLALLKAVENEVGEHRYRCWLGWIKLRIMRPPNVTNRDLAEACKVSIDKYMDIVMAVDDIVRERAIERGLVED